MIFAIEVGMAISAKARRLIEQHVAWLRLAGKTEATIKNRTGTLTRLGAYLGKTDILRASGTQLEGFLAQPGKAPSSRRAEVSHLKQFYKWLAARDHITRDPALILPVPRKPQLLPRPIALADAAMAIAMAPPDTKLILALACMCGLRAGEIARLKGTDVIWSSDPPLVHVRGKGEKERRVPVPPQLAEMLADAPRTGPLVRYHDPRRAMQHLPADNISVRANNFLHSIGLPSVHKLRHTAGTWFYQASGHDLLMTQRFLGHSSVVSTQLYAAIAPDDMGEVSAHFRLPLPDTPQPLVTG